MRRHNFGGMFEPTAAAGQHTSHLTLPFPDCFISSTTPLQLVTPARATARPARAKLQTKDESHANISTDECAASSHSHPRPPPPPDSPCPAAAPPPSRSARARSTSPAQSARCTAASAPWSRWDQGCRTWKSPNARGGGGHQQGSPCLA
jgi:hypothetical protein